MIKKYLLLSLVCFSLLSLSACTIFQQADTEETTAKKKKKKKKNTDKTEDTDEEEVEEEDEEEVVDYGDFEFLDLDVSLDIVNTSQKQGTYNKLNLNSTGYDKLAQAIDKLNTQSKTSYEKNADEDMYYENNYIVSRADNRILSIFLQEEAYGDYNDLSLLSSVTYDSKTGKKIALSDIMNLNFDFDKIYSDFTLDTLIKDPDKFKSRVKSMIADEASGKNDYTADQMIAWTLGYNGVSIFTPVEVTEDSVSYTKLIQFDIPYSKYPELYNKKYVAEPVEFAFSVASNGEFYYDLNGDKTPEHIKLNTSIDAQTYSINEYIVDIDGNVSQIDAGDLSGYSIEEFLFARVNDKNYLMFNERGDNDGNIVRVLDLNKLQIVSDTEFEPYPYFSAVGLIAYNPKKILLSNRIYTISTVSVSNIYEFGTDEKFKALNSVYKVESKLDFVSKVDLSVSVLSENGEVTENTTIPSGTHFYPYETDSTSYTDYKLLDGRTVRIPMTHDDEMGYGYTIQGLPIDEVFEGILFAG